MRNGALYVAVLLALTVATAPKAHAAKTVWSGLIIAENVEHPAPVPAELVPIEQTLKRLFGYNQFEIIGQSRKTLKTGQEDWLASSKYFALHVDARGEEASGYLLNLKLYKENEVLLELGTKLSRHSPLVIKGPFVGKGQLLLVLMIESTQKGEPSRHRHKSEEPASTARQAWQRFKHAVRDLLP
jgi:hypothetical protein